METPELGKLEKVHLREAWVSEPQGFTPWLAREENILILGDELGIELEVEQVEASVGGFRADILCRDISEDHIVVIENQLEKTDHKHLGQTVTYAAGLDAFTVVWIAERFTEEHRAALDWLNRSTLEEVRFFGIEIELWRIGKSKPAPKFNLVVTPNDWSKVFKRISSKQEPISESQKKQLEFWAGFREVIAQETEEFKPPKIYARNWNWWGLGKKGFMLRVRFTKAEVFVEVLLETRTYSEWFTALQEEKEGIEQLLGFPLSWNYKDKRKFSEIGVQRECDISDSGNLDEVFAWMLENMIAIRDVFKPLLQDLPDVPFPDPEDFEMEEEGA